MLQFFDGVYVMIMYVTMNVRVKRYRSYLRMQYKLNIDNYIRSIIFNAHFSISLQYGILN